jgi:surfeit locus 1 family protein
LNRYRPLLVPFLLTLICLAVLISLGLWQLERREWKLGLIERIEARTTGDPISLDEAKRFWNAEGDVEYYRLALTGRFLHEHERHLYGLVNGEAGWRVLTPLQTQGGDVIFVDRGFVPEQFRDPATRGAGQIDGEVSVTALARASEEGSIFTPDNQPSANRWFLRDVQLLNASLPENLAARAVPFMAEAEPMAVPGGWPRAGVTRLHLPNRHLEYAVTWFGLAASLALVFGFFARRQLSASDDPGADANIADRSRSV